MLNITGRFVTVFQPEIRLNISESIIFANLSSSEKNTDQAGNISYKNMSWQGRFVGEAFEAAKALRNGDKIDIIRGAVKNRYDKEKKTLYVDVVVFEFVPSDISSSGKRSSPVVEENITPDQDYS